MQHTYTEKVSQIRGIKHVQRECRCGSIVVTTSREGRCEHVTKGPFVSYWQRTPIRGLFGHEDEELAQELPCGPAWQQRPNIALAARLLFAIARNLCNPSEWS